MLPPRHTRILQWEEHHVTALPVNLDGSREGINETCDRSTAVVHAGRGQTNAKGYWRIKLPDLFCIPAGNQPPSVVATPIEEREPNDETAAPNLAILVAVAKGQVIEIWSLNPGGGAIRDVEFSWHCIVERR